MNQEINPDLEKDHRQHIPDSIDVIIIFCLFTLFAIVGYVIAFLL